MADSYRLRWRVLRRSTYPWERGYRLPVEQGPRAFWSEQCRRLALAFLAPLGVLASPIILFVSAGRLVSRLIIAHRERSLTETSDSPRRRNRRFQYAVALSTSLAALGVSIFAANQIDFTTTNAAPQTSGTGIAPGPTASASAYPSPSEPLSSSSSSVEVRRTSERLTLSSGDAVDLDSMNPAWDVGPGVGEDWDIEYMGDGILAANPAQSTLSDASGPPTYSGCRDALSSDRHLVSNVAPHSELCVRTTGRRFAHLRVVNELGDGDRIQLAVKVWDRPQDS
jgi:hypothetical protein